MTVLPPPETQPPSGPLWLAGGHLVDVRTGTVRRDRHVEVTGGRITQITADPPPAQARQIHLGGRYLLPGLISVHTHLSVVYPFSATDEAESPGTTALRALARAQDALRAGVTTIRCVHEQNRASSAPGGRFLPPAATGTGLPAATPTVTTGSCTRRARSSPRARTTSRS